MSQRIDPKLAEKIADLVDVGVTSVKEMKRHLEYYVRKELFPGRTKPYHSNHVFLVPVVAAYSQLLLKSVSKLFEHVEWSNSLLRHFKIQMLLKINCNMAAISAFGVTQHSQIFSLFFRNRVQCIALYQLDNSQVLLNLRRGCYIHFKKNYKIFWQT